MTALPAAERQTAESDPVCWCCGRQYSEERLVRLGSRPEAAVCFTCARFLRRRAKEQEDALRGARGLAARGRWALRSSRDFVLAHGWQNGRISGPVLRWIDKLLP